MKQIIKKYSDCGSTEKYYINDKGEIHGLNICYYSNGNINYKHNYMNDKLCLETWYSVNGEIKGRAFHL